ncbi:MAG: sodium:proton antiporter [Bacteroidaceae bacterium]|nr:sodium:proton antiporter [Bacteroidaceae bacterium]
MEALLIPIILVLSGLLVGVLFKSISQYVKVPYTVILFAVGILIGLLSRYGVFYNMPLVTEGIHEVADMNPNLILYVFLPILVFDAAYEMDLHIFKKTLLNASILAGPGLVICMLLTAAFIVGLSYILPGEETNWTNWTYALMFGGLISATDPVAVVALLQELKTSKRFSTLVDGESLLNDGTGIVCFMLFYSTFAGNAIEMGPIIYFLWVCLGSIIIGYIIARITLWFITSIASESVIQTSVMIISAYVTFIIAQYAFDISGVIALVVYGQFIAHKGRPRLKPQTNIFLEKFWGLLAYISNTLIFIIVGIIISNKVSITWIGVVFMLIVYIGIVLIRYIMIYMLYPLLKKFGYGINFRESIILGWGGLRGALGMTLALMVYGTDTIPQDIRDYVLVMTAGIITLTLCINATTSKWLLNKLGLVKGETTARQLMYARIQQSILDNDNAYIERLKQITHMSCTNWDELKELLPQKPDQSALQADVNTVHEQSKSAQGDLKATILAELRIKLLDKQRETITTTYENGIISQLSYTDILEVIDDLYDSEGYDPLNKHVSQLSMRPIYWLVGIRNFQKAVQLFPNNKLSIKFYASRVSKKYDFCRGFILAQEGALRLLDKISQSEIVNKQSEQEILNILRLEITDCIKRADFIINKLQESFPKSFSQAVTTKAIRMLLADERQKVFKMFQEGIITEEDTFNLIANINQRQANKIRG